MPLRVFECQNPDCPRPSRIFGRYGKTHTPRPKFCSHACAAVVNKPSDHRMIPAGKSVSKATERRRKRRERTDTRKAN